MPLEKQLPIALKFEPSSCPACGSATASPWRTYQIKRRLGFTHSEDEKEPSCHYVRCCHCDHRYMDPAPTEESLKAYYSEDYFISDDQATYNQSQELGLFDRVFFRLCRQLPASAPARVLEMGAGNGKYLAWLRELGHEVYGYDLGPYPMVKGLEGVPMQYGNVKHVQHDEAFFDVICSFWVFEHLKDTRPYLEQAMKWLKPGGFVVIAVPNVDCLDARLFGDYWHHAVVPDHLSQFSMDSATKMLDQAGFDIVRRQYDLLSFDSSLSLSHVLSDWTGRPHTWLQSNLVKCLTLPFAPIKSILGQSGLITVTGRKSV